MARHLISFVAMVTLSALVACRPAAKPATLPAKVGESWANSVGMKLVYIPAGEFMMGSPPEEAGRNDNELQHNVTLTRSFLMGSTEVTQGHWKAVMGTSLEDQRDPTWPLRGVADNMPMYYVSRADAEEFCRRLSQMDNRAYRLPTEAEWEYACRAGTRTRFHFGDAVADLRLYANYADASNTDALEWQDKDHNDGHDKASPVANYRPNAWGLYDMHGNLLEWCADWHAPYPPSPLVDPKGPANGANPVVRSSSWTSDADSSRAAARSSIDEDSRTDIVGFRVVMELP